MQNLANFKRLQSLTAIILETDKDIQNRSSI